MITDPDGWCLPSEGQDIGEFIAEFVASRPPFTPAEIADLRAIFRPVLAAEAAQHGASGADADAA
ncbi:hypothetical protein AB0N09_21685 [Streptomyces erythrochromogenes]|uniref:hypothetical protein n=1 Tax=Streptomyces erythrochromogenes TaxID=285574 RepID=UPI0034314794